MRGLLDDLFDVMAEIEDLLIGGFIPFFNLQYKIRASLNHLTYDVHLIFILIIVAKDQQLQDQTIANY